VFDLYKYLYSINRNGFTSFKARNAVYPRPLFLQNPAILLILKEKAEALLLVCER
jgi:hypothetical protein